MTGAGSSPVRAAVLEQVGDPALIRDLELIAPRAGEVRVRMLASGVCHSDLHVRDEEWDRPTPIVMGHEGAGVVEAVGPGGATGPDGTPLYVGQLVALSWLIPCGECRSCRRGHVWACPVSPSYRHTLLDGERPFRAADTGESIRAYCAIATMAEAVVVPGAAAIPMPDGTDGMMTPPTDDNTCWPPPEPCMMGNCPDEPWWPENPPTDFGCGDDGNDDGNVQPDGTTMPGEGK